ncbi:putative high affinity copper protein [Xylariales sp. AK1849]|nr:putative high affinity copper protein [Xylariales sp. AK1849]
MSMSMSMPGMSVPDVMSKATSTGSASTASSTTPSPTAMMVNTGDMSGMSEDGCKVSMLLNWYTIDACFLSNTWRIQSAGGFAGLCIGVILMSILLQFLGRLATMYDKHLIRKHQHRAVSVAVRSTNDATTESTQNNALIAKNADDISPAASFRPNYLQQGVRTGIRAVQFTLSYLLMLLAMYYNGAIIICIIIGAFIGIYIFQWERMGGTHTISPGVNSDPTGCCG